MTTVRVPQIPGLKDALEPFAERLDLDLLERAWQLSSRAHRGQKRWSGEEAVSHGVAVARILVELHLDSVSVACGLLHDVVEDTDVTVQDLEKEFGPEVATIVDGLTKISSLTFRSSAEEQVENYRKLLVSVARDARVIIVKLADRLHNMRTLEHLPEDKQSRIALETREIYAPLSHRFGMGRVRAELEDLAFKFLEPDEYRALARKVTAKRGERESLIERMLTPLRKAVERAGIAQADVSGRPKHLWSIHKKIQTRGLPYDAIYDLMAIRVLVNSVPDCYHALGVIHSHWTPLQERIKDYIAQPKSNGYQSLHTTIFGPEGHLYEIQIRTREMHHTAEYGIAAHWLYKEGGTARDELDRHLTWFRQLLDRQQEAQSPQEFLEFLHIDLYQDEIFVFTPEGDVKQLPKGATPIDFAFAVHTEVGLHCQGAKVNGRIAPLHRQLKNGDTVEILASPNAHPSQDWLSHVHTARARQKVRQWIRQEEYSRSVALGQEILARELRRRRLSRPGDEAMSEAARRLSLPDAAHVEAALGRGDLSTSQLMRGLFPDLPHEEADAPPPRPTAIGRLVQRMRVGKGIRIQGVDGLMVRYSQCCQPVPGDPVTGYVTRGRGISIHRVDCPNLLALGQEPERRLDLDWQEVEGELFTVRLALLGEDRRGLYADVCTAISGAGTNIRSLELVSGEGGMSGQVIVEVENLSHLSKVMKAIKRVKGIAEVNRRELLES